MTNFMFNIAKGRAVELFNRVDGNEPANSAIIIVPLSTSDSEANCQDYATLSDVLGGTPNEQNTGGWHRGTLTDTQLAAQTVDNTADKFPARFPSYTWTAPSAGNNTTGLLFCYDSDTTAGTDADIVPISHHDFAVTADGTDVILNAGTAVLAS